MFAARCIGISLAVFVLLYVPISIAVSRAWKLLWQFMKPGSARGSANFLFVLRALPFAVASIFTVVFTLPSFLLLEPRSTDEAVGRAPVFLGLCCLTLLLGGAVRMVSAQIKTSRALMKWLDGSEPMDSCVAVPVFRTGKHSPSLTVAGVRDPKVLVSEAAVAALTAPELRTALKHEMAHVRYYDNLKKLLFRFAAFPGMAALERAWSEQSEFAADDAAVSCFRDALDLAAALIKVSRLCVVQTPALVTTGLLHSSTALSTRVQRLCSWEENQSTELRVRWWYALPATAVFLCVVATYSSALSSLHAATEWLVR